MVSRNITAINKSMARPGKENDAQPTRSNAGSTGGNKRVYARRPATNRDRVLTQWRRVDLRADEVAVQDADRPASEILGNVLSRLKLEQRGKETEVMKVWNHLMDPRIAEHAQPAGIVKGTLFVKVDSSPWLDEIVRYRRKEILHRLQTAFGRDLIKKISFRVG